MDVVRRAAIGDLDAIVDIATVFNNEYVDQPLNPDKARTSLVHLIEDGVVFVTDTGAIVGAIYDDPFRDRTLLLEIGWYAEDNSRSGLRLLRKFIAEGRKLKVDAIVMSTLSTSSPRTRTLLSRLGFQTTEHTHTLEL
jgi:hypothetical protein